MKSTSGQDHTGNPQDKTLRREGIDAPRKAPNPHAPTPADLPNGLPRRSRFTEPPKEENETFDRLVKDYAEFRKTLPAWAKFLAIGQSPTRPEAANLQSQMFLQHGGGELMSMLCSDKASDRERAEDVILADVLGATLWLKKRIDMELLLKLNHDDVMIADEGPMERLLALGEQQSTRIESLVRTRRSLGQVGPLSLVVKSGGAPQQNHIHLAAAGDGPEGPDQAVPPQPDEDTSRGPGDE
ncbi:MAG: hypothetical protein HN406_15245 [Lentisphaerae bacterium]|jgi:hypothetical protein|nr:hypothetical protein [Lentisphaerota bacterium]